MWIVSHPVDGVPHMDGFGTHEAANHHADELKVREVVVYEISDEMPVWPARVEGAA